MLFCECFESALGLGLSSSPTERCVKALALAERATVPNRHSKCGCEEEARDGGGGAASAAAAAQIISGVSAHSAVCIPARPAEHAIQTVPSITDRHLSTGDAPPRPRRSPGYSTAVGAGRQREPQGASGSHREPVGTSGAPALTAAPSTWRALK